MKNFYYALAWLILITYLSLKPTSELPDIHIPFSDKIVHLGMYGGLSFFILSGMFKQNRSCASLSYLIAIAFCVLYGGLMELLQGSMDLGRSMDLADFIANNLGAVMGCLFFLWVSRLYVNGRLNPSFRKLGDVLFARSV